MVFGKLLIHYLRLNTKVLSSRQFFLLFFISRDFVPGYSRCARYWLPAKSTYNTWQPNNITLTDFTLPLPSIYVIVSYDPKCSFSYLVMLLYCAVSATMYCLIMEEVWENPCYTKIWLYENIVAENQGVTWLAGTTW